VFVKHHGGAWFRWNYLILELQEVILPGKSPPEKKEIGPWTGNFDSRVKFPTRAKNLREFPAEWAQERPLGDSLSTISFGCGFNVTAGVASSGTLPAGRNSTTEEGGGDSTT